MRPARTVLYRRFSPETNLTYLLVREGNDRPNLEISGIKMKSATPSIGAVLDASIRCLQPLAGRCLDTCGGLGYSAIEMARASAVVAVVSFEVDANVIDVARHNEDSRPLFDDPKIELRNEDVFQALQEAPDASFDRVFHDPPRLARAGELYSGEFYRLLFRVMRPGAKLFHYTGAPGEKAGKRVRDGVMDRLREAGFRRVRPAPVAQGVAALRP